jgi:hypothetical protein
LISRFVLAMPSSNAIQRAIDQMTVDGLRYPQTEEDAQRTRSIFSSALKAVLGSDWREWGPLAHKQDGSTLFDFGYYDVAALINPVLGVAAVVYLCEDLEPPFGVTESEDPPMEGVHRQYVLNVIADPESVRDALRFLTAFKS